MKKFALAAAALVVASPAVAQTAKVAGPRIEATVGWDRVILSGDGDSEGKSGVTYGGELGYDFMITPRATLGAYAGIDGTSIKDCDSDEDISGCLKVGRNITVGARAGYQVAPGSLLYIKGGYANGRIRASASVEGASILDESANLDGFHVGAGAEVGLGNGLYGKLEYTYTNYESVKFFGDEDGAGAPDADRHRVLIGAGFRF